MAGSNTAFIDEIPDLTQSQVRGWQHNHGSEYCGPVAVANSLLWMMGLSEGQIELVKRLASPAYMNTDIRKGTTTASLLRGVHRIAMDLFGGYSGLGYQGWKPHPSGFSTGIEVPEFDWITDGVATDAAVWLNVGWYRFDARTRVYHRVGGHWVTLAGFDGSTLIVHDPAPRAGHTFANEYVQTAVIRQGVLSDPATRLYRPAKGYLRLGGGMHIKPIADAAILDGAVKFRR